MNAVQWGQPATLEVTYEPGLSFVAMKVYDVTGTPALVATVPMVELVNGTYLASFTPASGKTYAVSKAVYTDGTYTTLDGEHSPGSETLQAVDLSPASQIDDLKREFLRILGLENHLAQAVATLDADLDCETEGEPLLLAEVVEIIDLNC